MTEPGAPELALDHEDVLRLLGQGSMQIEGRLIDASNATLFCTVSLDAVTCACVYKPTAGERPLWDFPDHTLALREVATYLVSEATGWEIVPPTVLRDGPAGPGMCQLWIDVDETVDLVELSRSNDSRLRHMSVFDAVVNNADRKGGHLLPTVDGHLYGVDHGVTFSAEDKLRTLLWQWRGMPLTDDALDVLFQLEADLDEKRSSGLRDGLIKLLSRREIQATRRRVRRLLDTGIHPEPSDDWPAIPWPPF